jgi:hypothetical protein
MDSGLDDWVSCTLHIYTTRDYRQYSAIADLHTLQFATAHALRLSSLAVSWQRIYNSLTVTSNYTRSLLFHSLIPFLPLFWKCQFRRLDSIHLLPSSYPGRLTSRNSTLHIILCCRTFLCNYFAWATQTIPQLLSRGVY